MGILEATYEGRDGHIYIFGNGGSLALATHWVSDFNKTVFSHHLDEHAKRFQAIRLPSTESEITAWANDVGYDMIFAGQCRTTSKRQTPSLRSQLRSLCERYQGRGAREAQSCSRHWTFRFRWGKAQRTCRPKILVATNKGEYEVVESVHGTILHLMIKYFGDYFDHLVERK